MEGLLAKAQEIVGLYGLDIIAAVVILIIGRWGAKIFRYFVKKMMLRGGVDATIVNFVGHLTYIALIIFVIIAALGQLGIQTTSFIAILGAAGLAIGLALQGSLSNFAAGFLMIIFRPFKVGDKIDAAGVTGVVEEIQIFTTVLTTPDNKTIIIPNSKITGDNIVNYSVKGTMRVDMTMGIGYGDDIDKARAVIKDVLDKDDRILKDPESTISVIELADSSVNFTVRPWAKSEDYFNVYFDVTEKLKKRFDEEGINIPFPQRDVHIYNHSSEN